MFLTLALPMLTLFLPIYSAPAPQYDDGYTPCAESTEYKDLSFTPQYTGGWQMTGAPPVTSDPISAASLTATYSESIGVTITEGFSLGAKLPGDVFQLGFDASVAWSYTTTTGWSSGEPCPPGSPAAYVCGLMGRPYLIDVSGTSYQQYNDGNCLNPGSEVGGSEVPFKFTAPVTSSSIQAPDGQAHADFQYSACICGNSANQTVLSGLPACPSPGCG